MAVLKDKALGVLSYNGWTFDSMHHSKLSNAVVYDDANRMVKWQEVSIEVEADIEVTDESNITALWNDLTEPGGTLRYTDKGFGQFVVNAPESVVRDVNWGPKPEMIDFVPTGGNRMVHVHWKVKAHVVSCPNAKYQKHLFNFTFETGFDINSDGYFTLSTNGSYEIPLTFATNLGAGGALTTPDTADMWWGRVCPEVPLGFQRITKNRKVSRDRRRVEYSLVDKEIPVPLPAGVTMIEAKHRVRNRGAMKFVIWTSTISGTVRVNPKLPRSASWSRFFLLLKSRIQWARTAVAPVPVDLGIDVWIAPGDTVPTKPQAAGVLLMDIEFEEDVFGIDNRFSCTYQLLGAPLHTILKNSGLWLPVPGTSHAKWAESMVNAKIHTPYGPNGARFAPSGDVMIDLCGGPEAKQVPEPRIDFLQAIPNPDYAHAEPPDSVMRKNSAGLLNQAQLFFSPEQSWLAYTTNLYFTEDDNIIRHKPLAGKVVSKTPRNVANGNVGPINAGTYSELLLKDWDVPDILQQVCSPDTAVVLAGTALRLGYRMSALRLVRFGGKEVTQGTANIQEVQLGNIQGIPVWGLAWRIEYALAEPAARMSTLANPLLGTSGSDQSTTFIQSISPK